MDSDASPSTKVAVNIINQRKCNSGLKHVPFVYAECPDIEDNMCKLMHCVDSYLKDDRVYNIAGFDIQYCFCADTKAEWQVGTVILNTNKGSGRGLKKMTHVIFITSQG